MTNLSNSELLDDTVSENLKSKRIEQVAKVANNPEVQVQQQVNPIPPQVTYPQDVQYVNAPQQKENVIQMNPMSKVNTSSNFDDDIDEDEFPTQGAPVMSFEDRKKQSKADKKILGMKPILFYGLTAVVVGVGGFLLYRHFKGKSAKKIVTGNLKPDSTVVITETVAPLVGATTEVAALTT